MEKSIEPAPENNPNRDILTEAIGEFGRWQILLVVFVVFPIKTIASWQQMSIIFLAQKTFFKCTATANNTEELANATCYSDCVRYEYYTDFDNTIISEWNLICDNAWLANFTQTVFMFGVLVGSVFFGFIADRYGRRPSLLVACVLQLTMSLGVPFAPSYWTFTSIRFLVGLATAGTMLSSFIMIMEVTGPKRRELVNCLAALPVPIGQIIMLIIGNYLRAWNRFSLGIGLPHLVFLLCFYFMPESPKWLISCGKFEEAKDILKKAAIWNKMPSENMHEVVKKIAAKSRIDENQKPRTSYMDLITGRSLRIKNLCSCTSWFILGLSFYGSNQYIGHTSSNVFVSMGLAGILQFPGILLSYYVSKKYGRRKSLIGLLIVCAISNGLLAMPDEWFYLKLVAGSLGISSASGAFSAMYMYTAELFPTVARNMALGASSTASRVGSMVAPFVAGVSPYWLPPAVFAMAPLVALAACWCLPETKGKTLDDLVEN